MLKAANVAAFDTYQFRAFSYPELIIIGLQN